MLNKIDLFLRVYPFFCLKNPFSIILQTKEKLVIKWEKGFVNQDIFIFREDESSKINYYIFRESIMQFISVNKEININNSNKFIVHYDKIKFKLKIIHK